MANRPQLLEQGVALSAPQDIRKEWLPNLFTAQKALLTTGAIPDEIATPLRDLQPESSDWILTEENIIGIPYELSRISGIYPMAGKRMATLKALFPEARFEFYFSVRSYDSFYRSMYSEVVRNRGFMTFEEFYDPERFASNSWVLMLAEITRHIPAENIVLWKFEDFRKVQSQALTRLSGCDDVEAMTARYAPETTRPSLSQKTLDVLGDLAPAIGAPEALRLTERINRHYAVADGHAPLNVFDEATTARLKAQYEADIAQIHETYPSITFL
ncbi:hypothetical protein [Shimia sp.]|uniref:hypothetical protein n=1 Tax=Shimia sp. TaxID=1954381 RepID=UPI0032992F4A